MALSETDLKAIMRRRNSSFCQNCGPNRTRTIKKESAVKVLVDDVPRLIREVRTQRKTIADLASGVVAMAESKR